MKICYSDTETFSSIPISRGVHNYSQNVEVLLWAFAIDDEPAQVWDLTNYSDGGCPPTILEEALYDPEVIFIFHNSQFDRTVIREALRVDIPVERIHDTMVQAAAHSLPLGLGALCDVYNIDQDIAKDKDGKKLIQLFSKPRPKNHKLRRATRETHPEEWAQYVEYARKDVESMRQLHKTMPRWNYPTLEKEQELWVLDQHINDRGFLVDTALAEGAITAVERAQKEINQEIGGLTDGEVTAVNQTARFLKYINDNFDVELPNMQAGTITELLSSPLPEQGLRELLTLRQYGSKNSTAKYKKLLESVMPDGRLCGSLQFCGASRTGRWAGRIFQPQNLPSLGLPPKEQIEIGIAAIKAGCAHLIFENVLGICSAALRGCITAPPRKKLVVADLSNIEGRIACWLAGEEWKIQAFREYDAGTGHDLYKLAYAKAFRIPPENVTKEQRSIGKVMELALGYAGGVGAFVTFANGYNIDLDELATTAGPTIPQWAMEEALGSWHWAVREKRTHDLSQRTYMVCDSLKRMWRKAHPRIVELWAMLENAMQVTYNTKQDFMLGDLTIAKAGTWMRIILPSGRSLSYPAFKIEDGDMSYAGVKSPSNKWGRIGTYGGKLFENCCQSVARDIMATHMPTIQKRGYGILLTVHDELITEAPDCPEYGPENYCAEELSEMMSAPVPWAEGLPLAAGGFEAQHYRKD